ncbi:hydrolase, alpha/beta fold family protein [Cryptosporidium serpentis]
MGKYESGTFIQGPLGRINYSLSKPANPIIGSPLVVCIHGLNNSISHYEELVEAINAVNLAVLRFDLPGHGLSSWCCFGNLTPQDCINQIDTLLENLNMSNIPLYLIGTSLGGLIAIYYAAYKPDRVLKVSAICPAGFCAKLSIFHQFALNYIPLLAQCIYYIFPLHWFIKKEKYIRDYYDPDKLDQKIIERRYFRGCCYSKQLRMTSLRVARGFNLWNNHRVYSDLRENYIAIRGHTGICFFLGLHDEVTPLSNLLPEIQKITPKSRMCIYRECKHQILEECSQYAIKDIVEYLKASNDIEYNSIGIPVDSLNIKDLE